MGFGPWGFESLRPYFSLGWRNVPPADDRSVDPVPGFPLKFMETRRGSQSVTRRQMHGPCRSGWERAAGRHSRGMFTELDAVAGEGGESRTSPRASQSDLARWPRFTFRRSKS